MTRSSVDEPVGHSSGHEARCDAARKVVEDVAKISELVMEGQLVAGILTGTVDVQTPGGHRTDNLEQIDIAPPRFGQVRQGGRVAVVQGQRVTPRLLSPKPASFIIEGLKPGRRGGLSGDLVGLVGRRSTRSTGEPIDPLRDPT